MPDNQVDTGEFTSITLLDTFAGQALTGILADPEDIECAPGMNCTTSVAYYAYQYARAMVKEKRRLEDINR
jgi:hypothetical protein